MRLRRNMRISMQMRIRNRMFVSVGREKKNKGHDSIRDSVLKKKEARSYNKGQK